MEELKDNNYYLAKMWHKQANDHAREVGFLEAIIRKHWEDLPIDFKTDYFEILSPRNDMEDL